MKFIVSEVHFANRNKSLKPLYSASCNFNADEPRDNPDLSLFLHYTFPWAHVVHTYIYTWITLCFKSCKVQFINYRWYNENVRRQHDLWGNFVTFVVAFISYSSMNKAPCLFVIFFKFCLIYIILSCFSFLLLAKLF